jgi:hypothetical protein
MYKTETEKHNLTDLSDSWSIKGGLIYISQVIP